jgi:hypothetical protein
MEMKVCSKCGIEQLLDDFYLKASGRDGHERKCKTCRREEMNLHNDSIRPEINKRYKEHYALNREAERARGKNKYNRDREKLSIRRMYNRYKLTPEQFNTLFLKQGKCCAICRSPNPGIKWWQVDHDHSCCNDDKRDTCGKCVRGILCHTCNKALGLLKDSPTVLQTALEYIKNKGLIYE